MKFAGISKLILYSGLNAVVLFSCSSGVENKHSKQKPKLAEEKKEEVKDSIVAVVDTSLNNLALTIGGIDNDFIKARKLNSPYLELI